MEPKKKKSILYSICFICLVFIDWIRGSQNGAYWATAINLTGMFVSILMMSHFRWKTEPKKVYFIWLALWFLGSVVGCGIWYIYPGEIFLSQYWAAAVSVCFVGVVAIRIWRERQQLMRNQLGNPLLLACWVVMSVLMSCSRMGEIWPLWYAGIFLLFYMIPFSAEERRDLWNGLANGLIAGFFMLQIFAYGFRPYDEVRYKGAFSNCNMNALFYLVTYIALLYRIHSLRWQEKWETVAVTWKRMLAKAVLWTLAAGIWGFIFLTMTRTALLGIVGITIVYGFIEFRIIYGEKFRKLLTRGVALLLGMVLTFPVVYLTVRYLPTILHHPIWMEGEYSIDKVHSFDSADSEKYVSLEEIFEGMGSRFGNDENEAAEDAEMLEKSMLLTEDVEMSEESGQLTEDVKMSEESAQLTEDVKMPGESGQLTEDVKMSEESGQLTEDTEMSEKSEASKESIEMSEMSDNLAESKSADEQEYLLTGEDAKSSAKIRLEIYKLYLKNMNLTGHELEEGYFQITQSYHAWHGQNIFLQIGFYYGIVAGILFVVVIVGLGIQSLFLAVRRQRCEDLLPLLVWLLFVGYGMLECVWYPGQTILLLIYLIPKIIVDSRQKVF